MINCEIDGIWCKKCNTLHPTLFWHEKYNDYELNRREKFEEGKKKRPNLLKDVEFTDYLPKKDLEETKEEKGCIICGYKTFFKNLKTNNYICSDECKYKDNKQLKK